MKFDLQKNVYNNWLNKGIWKGPLFEEKEIEANFEHIRKLYSLERGKPVKLAHRLSEKCLSPSSIERCNVQLSNSVFHESTAQALYFYALNGYPEFEKTANFITVFEFCS